MPQTLPMRQSVAALSAIGRNYLACACAKRDCGVAMIPDSPLDDPDKAAFAWARYRKLMRWMVAFTLSIIVAAMVFLYRSNGFVSIHFYIATALGIGFAMMLMSALMGLVFLSAGTGHDDAIIDPLEDENPS
jgi:heme/copper-type cytochrome/quinol oxidase subunit 4